MGRPRLHDEQTAEHLLDAAERMIAADGPDALSLRRLAEETQTSTRAVYSLFGNKDGLVLALATRAFEMLGAGINALPRTPDPAADLVDAGVLVFRRFAVEHPSLFRLAFQHRDTPPSQRWPNLRPTAQAALAGLGQRIARLGRADGLADTAASQATIEFHALCEGLAALELRGILPIGNEERVWRHALAALVRGLDHDAFGPESPSATSANSA